MKVRENESLPYSNLPGLGEVRGTNSMNSLTIACPFSSTVILKAVGIYIWDIGDSAQFPSDAGTQLALDKLAD